VIVSYAIGGWDPVVRLFFWGWTAGGIGVLLLIFITSLAVIVFFARNQVDESPWRRAIAPVLATACLAVVLFLALKNFRTLLGPDAPDALVWGVPIAYLIVGLLGVGWGLILRSTRPEIYDTIGLGARSATAIRGSHQAGVGAR
jgi:peptidoglycan/LPS O-acetylase OafA/YrhL